MDDSAKVYMLLYEWKQYHSIPACNHPQCWGMTGVYHPNDPFLAYRRPSTMIMKTVKVVYNDILLQSKIVIYLRFVMK